MLSGKLFQSSRIETVKARDPQDFRLKFTGLRRNAEDDGRVLDGDWSSELTFLECS